MAFVNKISNFFLGAASITAPTGVWESIIMWFNSGITNYGWAIIVFTLVLKVVLSPLDFFNKKVTDKNNKLQAVIQPEIAKIQKQYGNNKQIVNQKTMEIYKKYNYNVTGSCLIMVINLALTLFIFISLFAGLNTMASYKVGYQYQEMETVYNETVISTNYDDYLTAYQTTYDTLYSSAYNIAYNNEEARFRLEKGYTDETILSTEEIASITAVATTSAQTEMQTEAAIEEMTVAGISAADGKTEAEMVAEINTAVLAKYNQVKDSWLWVSNIWRSDTPWTKSVASFDEFVSMAGITYKTELNEGETETFKVRLETSKASDKETYENVMNTIETENGANGYLIIPILAIASTILSMLATQGKLKFGKKKQTQQQTTPAVGGGWLMVILLGGLMGYFTISYNSVFALYILVGSLFGLASTPIFNFGIKKINEMQEKRKAKLDASYKRK